MGRKSNKKHTQAVTAPQTPRLPLGQVYDDEERLRMEASYREYTLTEEERLAIIEKYGPPLKPMGSYNNIAVHKRMKGGGAA